MMCTEAACFIHFTFYNLFFFFFYIFLIANGKKYDSFSASRISPLCPRQSASALLTIDCEFLMSSGPSWPSDFLFDFLNFFWVFQWLPSTRNRIFWNWAGSWLKMYLCTDCRPQAWSYTPSRRVKSIRRFRRNLKKKNLLDSDEGIKSNP